MTAPIRAGAVYARIGWRVLPVRSGEKVPLLKDWPAQASNDPEVVTRWTTEHPTANIGVAMGSGTFALDVDPRHGGDVALAALIAKHGPLPLTPESATPSGGSHYVFTGPPGITNSASRVGQGLDIRGDGGQIVVAPSTTPAGQYRWVVAPWDVPPAPAPAWLLERLGRASPAADQTAPVATGDRGYYPPASAEVLDVARADLARHGPAIEGQGGGLHTVHAAAIITHDHALSEDEAWQLFTEWNETCQPSWDLDGGTEAKPDLRIMLRRGAKYGKLAYGCRRTLDALETARKLIRDWQEGDPLTREASMFVMVERVRALPFADPLKRSIAVKELQNATGMGTQALDIPRAVKRADPREVSPFDFDVSSTGAPVMNLNNAVKVLEIQKRKLWFDDFANQIQSDDGEWNDDASNALTLEMQRNLGLTKMPVPIVQTAVATFARRNTRDRVRELLDALEWDNTERVAGFLTRAFGAVDSEYTRAASANFWKSLVARPLSPGCKVDNMLVLEGDQGLKKSTALHVIAGDRLFAEASASPTDKDFFLALVGKLLVEIGELDSFKRADVTAVKRVLSCQIDRYRAPYERATRDWPRRGIFVGTTNRPDWNLDDTGARRFWPVTCVAVDLPYIRDTRLQLFAEAVARVNAGESWWEMPDDQARAEQEARRQVDPWETLIEEHIELLGADKPLTAVGLLSGPLNVDAARMTRQDETRVARILRRLGYSKRAKQREWKRAG